MPRETRPTAKEMFDVHFQYSIAAVTAIVADIDAHERFDGVIPILHLERLLEVFAYLLYLGRIGPGDNQVIDFCCDQACVETGGIVMV